jgi:hypothetical protein
MDDKEKKILEYLGKIVEDSRKIGIAMSGEQRMPLEGGEITYNGSSVRAFVRINGREYSIHISRIH